MIFELEVLRRMMGVLADRVAYIRAHPDDGYSTEAVIVIALLVAMAVTAVGVIAAKVISTAHNISTGGS
ncbi:MAG TPA: hypothetical protein VFP54_06400 [Acidimicrobiales bacterium]|nr:hypothetical protein [Acidimicrobiales bacterium]